MNTDNDIWNGDYKIPWHRADFSRRMLAEHLSQDHDLASRRWCWIDSQVQWIHNQLLGGTAAAILDLGCGPGLYSQRLVALGHSCQAIDFSPASIEYARSRNSCGEKLQFALGDIRSCDYGSGYDLAMLIYGEFNVFSPAEAAGILARVASSLAVGAQLIIELQDYGAIRDSGSAEPVAISCESGLFADEPYTCTTTSKWLAESSALRQEFEVVINSTGRVDRYRNTTRAWSEAEFTSLLTASGFGEISCRSDWPCDNASLKLWRAVKLG